jgi:hypothetical protein
MHDDDARAMAISSIAQKRTPAIIMIDNKAPSHNGINESNNR